MRRALKITGWGAGILILLSALGIWRSFFFYSKVWKAHITVGGRRCGNCAIYVRRSGIGDAGVLVRRDQNNPELYSVAFPSTKLDVPNGAVWKCVDGAFSFAPGLAFDHIHQWCAPWGFPSAQKQVRMNSRLIEFTADDGKRVRAEW